MSSASGMSSISEADPLSVDSSAAPSFTSDFPAVSCTCWRASLCERCGSSQEGLLEQLDRDISFAQASVSADVAARARLPVGPLPLDALQHRRNHRGRAHRKLLDAVASGLRRLRRSHDAPAGRSDRRCHHLAAASALGGALGRRFDESSLHATTLPRDPRETVPQIGFSQNGYGR
ncbi:unnamed protein product [Prorocentrum cordatum]|uniref:Uncharacterized protein n=1 Tax=Prorocentrum cordatum TaxID=2364126 RepID=A0ABN9TC05_9DINO|nr:unnamed protein product [Polarella glacialis]